MQPAVGTKQIKHLRISKRWSDRKLALLLITPPLIYLLLFTFYPIVRVFWMSLHEIKVSQPWLGTTFIGFENYITAFQDARFWHSFNFTLAFSVITVIFEIIFGILLALIANQDFKFRGFVRAAILFPWILPVVTNALTWRWMLDRDFGLFNGILMQWGIISEPIFWLGSPEMAFTSVSLVSIWKTSSFMAIILLAGLQSIPGDVYEAARIDGAGPIQSFFRITVPLIRNVIMVALVLRTLHAMQAFDLLFGLTQGGPGNSTESLPMYIHSKAFLDMDWGYGSALGVILFLFILLFTLIYVKVLYKPD